MANVVEILVKGKDQFSPSAKKAQASAKGLRGTMGGLGKTMLGVGAGFIAAQASIAGVSKLFSSTIGAAAAFEKQLAQIRGLTGATKEDTDFLSGAIKDMARAMPKSPAELGAGAYFILSAGITDSAEAAQVLEISAKASAAGLGETRVVADAVTSALNAYKLEAGEAGRITDILTTTVRLGKTEAAALAGSIGRILPVAAAMGVSFEEVGANLAVMTKVGLSADEAATSLRAVMTQLLRPTTEAAEALAELGLSGEGLRKQIREKGLLAALSTLMKKTGGNTEQITKIIPNVRALTNVLGTVGSQAETYADTLDQMNEAQGATDKAFKEVADTAQFKMEAAISRLNVALLELGEGILPPVISGLEVLASIVGAVASGVDTATEAADAQDRVVEKLVGTTEDEMKALLGLHGAMKGLAAEQKALTEITVEEAEAQKAATAEAAQFDAALRRIAESTGIDIDLLAKTGLSVAELEQEFASAGASIGLSAGEIQGEIDSMSRRAADFASVMEDEVAPTAVGALEDIEGAADDARSALRDMFRQPTQEEAAAELVLANYRLELGKLVDASAGAAEVEGSRAQVLKDTVIPAAQDALDVIGLEKDAIIAAAEAQDTSLPTLDTYISRIEDLTGAVTDADQAQRDAISNALKPYEDELLDQQRILKDVRTFTDEQTAAMQRGEEEYLKQVDIIPRVTGLTRDQFFAIRESEQAWIDENRAQRDAGGASEDHLGKLRLMQDGLNTDIRPAVRGLTDDLNSIPSSISTRINVMGFDLTSLQRGLLAGVVGAQHGFHGDVTRPTVFLAGEDSKRERVDITPGGGGGGGGVSVTINVETLIGGEDAVEELADMLMPAIRRRVA